MSHPDTTAALAHYLRADKPGEGELDLALTAVRELSLSVDGGRAWDKLRAALGQDSGVGALDQRLKTVEQAVQHILSVVCTPSAIATYVGDGLVFVPTSLGFPLVAFADDLQVTSSLLMRRQWDVPTTHLLERVLRPGDSFLDIGANIGYFTVFGAALVGFNGRVHAFEPNPRTFSLLTRNVRLNACSHVCDLHQAALADRIDSRVLKTYARNQAGSTLAELPDRLHNEWHERPVSVTVPSTTLDASFEGSGVVFNCIKMDAEGSEGMIWAGGDRFFHDHVNDRTIILLEWNPLALQGTGTDREGLMSLFARYGFLIWRRDDRLTVTPVNDLKALDDSCNSELVLARDASRIRQVFR